MLFFSKQYIFIFLPIIIIFFNFIIFDKKKIKLFLIVVSLFFYSHWNYNYLPLLLFIIFINYFFGKKLIKNPEKPILFFAIFINVMLLALFKYLDFIIENINFAFQTNLKTLNLSFPLALSFITFQVIAYLINCYDKVIKKIEIKNFFLFICFFPQLIAGPIVNFKFMISQFDSKIFGKSNLDIFLIGILIFLIGLIKKILLADTLGNYVDYAYGHTSQITFLYAWLASLSFTFQLYFDFSGYVDMAIGSALMLNIFLPINFNSPLSSTSIIDFWRKWHITLSNFLTNYMYSPIAKSIKNLNFFKSMIIIIFVFCIAGIWHGPTWMFFLFGLSHGVALSINHLYRRVIDIKLNKIISFILTFNFVNFSFIFFRSENLQQFKNIFFNMISFNLDDELIFFNLDYKFFIIFLISSLIIFLPYNSSYILSKFKKN